MNIGQSAAFAKYLVVLPGMQDDSTKYDSLYIKK